MNRAVAEKIHPSLANMFRAVEHNLKYRNNIIVFLSLIRNAASLNYCLKGIIIINYLTAIGF
jgi:hypothetical protein